MQATILCPSCQRELRLPEVLMGKLVKCPACGTTFTASLPEPPAQADIQPATGSAELSPPREDYPEESLAWDEEEYEDRPMRRRRRRYSLPHRGGAILTLGILSLVICGLLGPFAWIMGNTDLREIRAGRMDPQGEGLTQAGRILGIIGSVKGALELCYVGVILVAVLAGAMH